MKASRALPLLLAAALAGCIDSTRPGQDDATLYLSAIVTGTAVDQLVVTVSAADIPLPLVFNIPVANGTASGTIRIPPGAGRTIVVQAFDATGEVTHEGSALVDVHPGQNPPVTIVLRARSGHVPIIVTIADVTVQVDPNTATLTVGQTVQLTATIIGPNSETLPGTFSWATTNPAIATVDQQGLVTGLATGQALIVAVSEGDAVAGTSQISVGAGSGGTPGSIVITEFLANPNAVADGAGEWLELRNTTNDPVNVEGWTIFDDGVDNHQINVNGAGLFIQPGGYLVLGINAVTSTNGGALVSYQYANFLLSNSDDEIVLRDGLGAQIDRVNYNAGTGWPVFAGRSTSLDPTKLNDLQNDVPSAWCAATSLFGFGGDMGTPGAANDPCPPSGVPTIQSLLPGLLPLAVGEQGALTVTITIPAPAGGVTVGVAVTGGPFVTAPPSVTIPAGQVSAQIPVTALSPGLTRIEVTLNGTSASSDVEVVTMLPLQVIRAGTGSGTVTSNPAGIDCGLICTAPFANGTLVTLTAVPAGGSVFAGWSGGGCTGTGACLVTMTQATTVTATFTLEFTLTVVKAGTGSGTVTSNPAGVDCGVSCTAPFAEGALVTLTAVPAGGSVFAGWSGGGCTGTGACVVTMTQARTVTANFDLQ